MPGRDGFIKDNMAHKAEVRNLGIQMNEYWSFEITGKRQNSQ
jgi:hypothetical protein